MEQRAAAAAKAIGLGGGLTLAFAWFGQANPLLTCAALACLALGARGLRLSEAALAREAVLATAIECAATRVDRDRLNRAGDLLGAYTSLRAQQSGQPFLGEALLDAIEGRSPWLTAGSRFERERNGAEQLLGGVIATSIVLAALGAWDVGNTHGAWHALAAAASAGAAGALALAWAWGRQLVARRIRHRGWRAPSIGRSNQTFRAAARAHVGSGGAEIRVLSRKGVIEATCLCARPPVRKGIGSPSEILASSEDAGLHDVAMPSKVARSGLSGPMPNGPGSPLSEPLSGNTRDFILRIERIMADMAALLDANERRHAGQLRMVAETQFRNEQALERLRDVLTREMRKQPAVVIAGVAEASRPDAEDFPSMVDDLVDALRETTRAFAAAQNAGPPAALPPVLLKLEGIRTRKQRLC